MLQHEHLIQYEENSMRVFISMSFNVYYSRRISLTEGSSKIYI